MTSAYNLFKENLGVAEMLIYVHAFNLSNWALELDFVLGEKDMEQWKVSIGTWLYYVRVRAEDYLRLVNP